MPGRSTGQLFGSFLAHRPAVMLCRVILNSFILLTVLGAETGLAEGFSLEAVNVPPESIGPALKSTLNPDGVRILNETGQPWCEVWLRQEIASSPQPASPEAQYSTFHSGLLLGVIRFPADGSDYRGLPVKKGTYTMRYGVMPQDGNHVGAAPIVDFVLLIPVADDKSEADAMLTSEDLVKLSRKASGTNHPAIMNLAFPPDSVDKPTLEKFDPDHWVLSVPIRQKPDAELPLSIIVYGQAAG